MFSGIITDVGRVAAIERRGDTRYIIETAFDTSTIEIGASVAHNGVCLTVIETSPGRFAVEASAETLSRSTLGDWAVGTEVNLERSLRLGDEIGGHLVYGHVDGVGTIVDRRPEGDSVRFTIEAPAELADYHRLQGLGRHRRRLADRQRGRRHPVRHLPLRRQHHSAHAVMHDLSKLKHGSPRELGDRHAGAVHGAPAAGSQDSRLSPDDQALLSPIDEIIEEARQGRMFILVDDEDRENEGDLVIPAQMATPEAVNFMARYGRGLICLAMEHKRIDELGLPLMTRSNASRHQTAFTVSIEAREGVTTGISAADRARTIAVAIDPACGRGRHRHARPRLPAGGARRRRAGAHRPYRGGGRHLAPGRAATRPG